MKVTVKVTDKMGDPLFRSHSEKLSRGCMVSQALGVVIRDGIIIDTLGCGEVELSSSLIGPHETITLPRSEVKHINDYDMDIKVPAHEFEVNIPARYLRPHHGK